MSNPTTRRILTTVLCAAVVLSFAAIGQAANHYVRAGASGNGSNWSNAYGSLPVTLVRGDTYYIADGSYGGYTFDDTGTSTITIRKATAADHGTSTGWSSAYGDGVAHWSNLTFSQGYYVFDGVTGGGPTSWRSGHGFDVTGSGNIITLNNNAHYISFLHTEVHGPNLSVQARGINGTVSDPTNINVSYCWFHDIYGIPFYMLRWDTALVEYSCIEKNKSTSAHHAEGIMATGSSRVIIRYNLWSEIQGTAVIAGVNAGYAHEDWEIYGNIFALSTYWIYMYNQNNSYCWADGWKIYNNTIVGPTVRGNINGDIRNSDVYNNLWHDFQEPSNYMTFKVGDRQYNSLYDVDLRSSTVTGTNLELSGDPLVNHANGNFNLTGATAAGTTLSAPYNVDMFGNIRGGDGNWDRGAIEYVSGGNQNPVADAGPNQTVTDTDDNGSQNVTLDGSGSYDNDGSISSYVWKENSSQIATGVGPTLSFTVAAHTVELTVTDNDSATDTDTVVITVQAPAGNQDPVADAGPDQSVTDTDEGGDESVTLDGSGSSDSDGTISSYVWKEDSTQIATGSGPSVTLDVGSHTIVLTVTDDDSATDTDTVIITVNAPGGSTTTTYQVAASADDAIARQYSYASSGVYIYTPDEDGKYLCYMRWALDIPSGATVTDAYLSLSAYSNFSTSPTVRMQLLDEDDCSNFSSNPWSRSVTSNYVDWTTGSWSVGVWYDSADITDLVQEFIDRTGYASGNYLGLRGYQVSGSDYKRARSYDYSGNAHGPKLVVTYTTGAGNVAPTADADSDQTVTDTDGGGDQSVSLDGSASSDSDGTIVSWVWEEDSSQIATGETPAVTMDVGVHTIDLTVTDDDDATDSDSVIVTVVSRTLTSTTSFQNTSLPTQTGVFTAEFDVVPHGNNIDACTSLSDGAVTWWPYLACTVRFHTDGEIDVVYDDDAYGADNVVSYSSSTTYHFRMVIDIPASTYSVYVTPQGQSEVTLATDYNFRLPQVGVTSLDNWSVVGVTGTHTVSNLTIAE